MQPSASRPLALAPAPASTQSVAPDPSSEAGDSPLSAPSPTSLATGIRRASTACQSCKQIKRKCDQAQPCSNCRKSNTRCVYNEADDGRRKAARKRNVETLELKRDALDSILDSFRSSSHSEAQALMRLIRDNAPLHDIVQFAAAHDRSTPRGHFQSIAATVHDQPRKSVMSVTALCDTPLFQVRAEPWTAVTSDDDLVSHLISIFFTWYHPAYPTMDQDLFLRDMLRGEVEAQFCSPLLVNAMLALACHFSDHPMSCRVPSDGTTRGQHFFRAASSLWTAEEGKPTLLNIQAVSLLAVTACLLGKDRVSWSYIEQMNAMNRALAVRRIHAQRAGMIAVTSDLIRSEAVTSWTCFLLTIGYGIAFLKLVTSELLVAPERLQTADHAIARWLPYPQQRPEVMIPLGLLHEAYCTLHEIAFEIQTLLFGGQQDTQGDHAMVLDQKLSVWQARLAQQLRVDDEQNSTNPPVMDLHLAYHFFRISLFNFLKRPDDSSWQTDWQQNPVMGDAPAPAGTSTFSEQEANRSSFDNANLEQGPSYPESQTYTSAKIVASLCRRYARDFGLKQVSMWMPQASASAAYSLLHPATSFVHAETAEVFHELCLVLVSASRRWLVMKGHVRMLLMTARAKGLELPSKTRDLLSLVALDQWREGDHKMFTSSAWPNYALAKDDDPLLAGMGDLLEMWAHIEIKTDHLTKVEAMTASESTEAPPKSKVNAVLSPAYATKDQELHQMTDNTESESIPIQAQSESVESIRLPAKFPN